MSDVLAGRKDLEGQSIQEIPGCNPTNHRPQPPSSTTKHVLRDIL